MKLALALGKTRRELLASLDSAELTFWMAFDRVDPFGQERGDLRAGMIAANYSNWKRSPNAERFKPSDFMWKYGGGETAIEEQTPDQVEAAIDDAMQPLIQTS
jgi:hypothetical protein